MNLTEPAFPLPETDQYDRRTGLTKLEYAAIHIAAGIRTGMQGQVAWTERQRTLVADEAIAQATALLQKLG
jgi:hypothetical protein